VSAPIAANVMGSGDRGDPIQLGQSDFDARRAPSAKVCGSISNATQAPRAEGAMAFRSTLVLDRQGLRSGRLF